MALGARLAARQLPSFTTEATTTLLHWAPFHSSSAQHDVPADVSSDSQSTSDHRAPPAQNQAPNSARQRQQPAREQERAPERQPGDIGAEGRKTGRLNRPFATPSDTDQPPQGGFQRKKNTFYPPQRQDQAQQPQSQPPRQPGFTSQQDRPQRPRYRSQQGMPDERGSETQPRSSGPGQDTYRPRRFQQADQHMGQEQAPPFRQRADGSGPQRQPPPFRPRRDSAGPRDRGMPPQGLVPFRGQGDRGQQDRAGPGTSALGPRDFPPYRSDPCAFESQLACKPPMELPQLPRNSRGQWTTSYACSA